MDSPRSGPYLLERPTHFASAVAAARTAWRHSPLGEPEGLFFSVPPEGPGASDH
jgi:hypothetical protein